jgi:hypothetical protein
MGYKGRLRGGLKYAFCLSTTNVLSLENITEGEQIKIEAIFTFNPLKLFGITGIPIKINRIN